MVTNAASEAIDEIGCRPADVSWRYVQGDWGDLPDEDKLANEYALWLDYELVGCHPLPDGTKIYMITDAKRTETLFMTAEEYEARR